MAIELTELQKRTLDVVRFHDKASPITGKNVANAIGLKHRDTGKEGADLRSIVNALRHKGFPICASGRGYYYPRNREEIGEYTESLSGRIEKMQEALEGMKTALPLWDTMPEIREVPDQGILEI